MIVQQDGVGSIKNMGLQKMDTTRFFKSKEELALYVNDTLTRSDPEEILQSITIMRLEKSEVCYAIGVTMYC
jgi:DNA-binding phage protein